MIDRQVIASVLDAADIVDVVKDFVALRKAGVNYKGLCPFHSERTPSFVVSPSKQRCKCFSCGKGGDVAHFIMEHEQMTFPEAIKWLGRKYGIEVEEKEMTSEQREAASKRESLLVLNEWARDWFASTLRNDAEGLAAGMAYFRSRGFRDDIVRKFQLGYALEKRDAFAQAATKRGFQTDALCETGLCFRTDDGRLLDRYHGRVIFPVHTISGRVVAFGGRILGNDKKLAKYVNSPESAIYSKSNELYGLFLAKQAIVKEDRCYLVEGYTDVISMHQSGVENVVASSGTSLTTGQIRLLHRFTHNITVLYDGDAAGIKASLRGIDMLLAEGMNIKVLLLPDGDDPDSFARKHNAQEYKAFIEAHQEDFIRFKTRILLQNTERDPVKRAEVTASIMQSISVIPSQLVRQAYIHEVRDLMQVREEILVAEVAKIRRKRWRDGAEQITQNLTKTDKQVVSTLVDPQAGHNQGVPQSADLDALRAEEEESSQRQTQQQSASEIGRATDVQGREERLIAQLLIRYGCHPVCMPSEKEDVTPPQLPLALYIREDLQMDGLSFTIPLYQTVLDEACALAERGETDTLSFFMRHTNPEVCGLASELGLERYILTPSLTQDYRPEEERLEEVASHLLYDFKYAYLQTQMQKVQTQLYDPELAGHPETLQELLQRYKQLTDISKAFAFALGERVVLRA